jgi:hypothetical protein
MPLSANIPMVPDTTGNTDVEKQVIAKEVGFQYLLKLRVEEKECV